MMIPICHDDSPHIFEFGLLSSYSQKIFRQKSLYIYIYTHTYLCVCIRLIKKKSSIGFDEIRKIKP